MSGIGGLFYIALLGVAIITRRYKKRNTSAKRVAPGVLIFVFAAVLIGGLQAFKAVDIKNMSLLMFFKIKDGIYSGIKSLKFHGTLKENKALYEMLGDNSHLVGIR